MIFFTPIHTKQPSLNCILVPSLQLFILVHTSFLKARVGENIFVLFFFCCLDKIFRKICKSLAFCRKVMMSSYRIDKVECNLEFIVFCYGYCHRVSPEHFTYVWNYCAIFSSVLLIRYLFGFYLCSFLFLLPRDVTPLLLMSEADELGSQCTGSGAAQPLRNTAVWIL